MTGKTRPLPGTSEDEAELRSDVAGIRCAVCSERFEPRDHTQQCCGSSACRLRWWRKRRRTPTAVAMVTCQKCGRTVPRRGRLYQRFCAGRGCRAAWWKNAREKAIEARDRRKWGAAKIARWLSTSEYTISEATVRRLLGQPRRCGRKRKRKGRSG